MVSQGCLVTLTVFAGGLFRPFDEASIMMTDDDPLHHLVVRFLLVPIASELGRSTVVTISGTCIHTREEFALSSS